MKMFGCRLLHAGQFAIIALGDDEITTIINEWNSRVSRCGGGNYARAELPTTAPLDGPVYQNDIGISEGTMDLMLDIRDQLVSAKSGVLDARLISGEWACCDGREAEIAEIVAGIQDKHLFVLSLARHEADGILTESTERVVALLDAIGAFLHRYSQSREKALHLRNVNRRQHSSPGRGEARGERTERQGITQ